MIQKRAKKKRGERVTNVSNYYNFSVVHGAYNTSLAYENDQQRLIAQIRPFSRCTKPRERIATELEASDK